MPISLTNQQQQKLYNMLLAAFPSVAELAQMVRFGLDKNLAEIAGTGNLQSAVFDLLTWAGARDKYGDLITAAQAAVPERADLRAFAASVGLPVSDVSAGDARSASGGTQPANTNLPQSAGINFYGPTNVYGPAVGGDVQNLTYTGGPSTTLPPSTSSPTLSFKERKHKNLQDQHDLLIAQYDEVAAQLLHELNPETRVTLKHKSDTLEKQIEELEAQLAHL